MNLPTAFHDLPPEVFPFTVEFYRGDEQVHTIRVEGPGGLLIPALGVISRVRLVCDNGDIIEHVTTD